MAEMAQEAVVAKTLGSYEAPHQVGGHEGGVLFEGDRLLKLCGHRSEVEFYSKTAGHPVFQPFLPKFHGVEVRNGQPYVVLENLVAGLAVPALLDLKVGTRTYGDDASPAKIASRVAKDNASTTGTIGVNVVGCQMYNDGPGMKKVQLGHKFKKDILSAEEVRVVLLRFLRSERLKEAARRFVGDLLEVFRRQTEFAFYGSSLLLAYDAALGDDAHLRVKMIDFAHVHPTPNGGLDESYLTGLQFLAGSLK
eukprot:GGOE01003582.1.p2 GENE.GGOE01003582.1~~GGOE01003582.1.p2  ORF type:complete len:267 (+),score=87.84 GGOE01003582.1:49-801(+)